MTVPIKSALERIPGGMMLVPLIIGAAIHTLTPNAGTFFGSFTGAFFTGLAPILAVFFFCLGASLDVRATPYILKKGGVLLGTKVSFAILVGLVAGRTMGEAPVTGGFFTGLSVLAIVGALNDTNGGLYLSLMGQYGRKKDAGAYSIMSLESGPFLSMVTLGIAGLSAFPWQAFVGALLPLVLGMLIGNLDPQMKALFAAAVPAMVPFLGLALGLTIDLTSVLDAGLLGIVLGLFVVFVGGTVLLVADKLTGGDGVAGLAAATTAGNAALVPAIIAEANPVYVPAAQSATVLVAASVVVTAILCPVVTATWYRHLKRRSSGSAGDTETHPADSRDDTRDGLHPGPEGSTRTTAEGGGHETLIPGAGPRSAAPERRLGSPRPR